jgi:predicted transposase/invertase (TIGR01784 family)
MAFGENENEIIDHIKNPHDRTFKKLMSHLQVAKDMFCQHLPKEVLKVINLDTLVLTNANYVDAQLHESASDVVYQVKTTGNKHGYIYCLCEHQSTPDKNMPFRFLQYTCRIMGDHLSQGHKYLPLVIPILVYNGERTPYPYSVDLFDQFADKSMAEQLMFKPAQLVDLTAISDDQLLQRKQADVFLKIL